MSSMNGLIRQALDERRHIAPANGRAVQLDDAQRELDRARAAGDEIARQQAEARIDQIISDARQAATPPPVDFDAGARAPIPPVPTFGHAVRAALQAHYRR